MTKDQWLTIKPGDVIVDTCASNAERTVLTVRRVSGKRGQAGHTRTVITLQRLHPIGGRPIVVLSSDDLYGVRFIYYRRHL